MTVHELTVELLRRINIGFIGYHEYPKSYTCDSCYSSYAYYGTAEEIACDIVVKSAKSHYFPNGNKRIATVMYSILCDDLELEVFDRYCKLLFPYWSRN